MTSQPPESVEDILAKLAKDVEMAVHALYRRQAGPGTTQVRTSHLVRDAQLRISAIAAAAPRSTPTSQAAIMQDRGSGLQPRFTASIVASSIPSTGGEAEWTAPEAAAVIKCVQAWLPVGAPATTKPETKCIASGKELLPTWADRELARAAVRKIPVQGA